LDTFRRAALWALSLAFVCVVLAFAARNFIEAAERDRIFPKVALVPKRRTAIVLGARVYPDGTPSPILADRVACALELYRAHKVERILVSGDHRKSHYDEVNAMATAVLRAGIDERAVFRDHAGFRTLDTMQRASIVFEVHDAIVCTQRFHLPRSLYLARSFGIDAVGLVADRRAYPSALHSALREGVADVTALFDLALGRSAHFLGAHHPITGDGRSTLDRKDVEE